MFLLISQMMRKRMMTFGNTELGKAAIVAAVANHERGNSSGVGLKRQHKHVQHQTEMLIRVFREISRPWVVHRHRGGRLFLGTFNAAFDFTNRVQVFIEFPLIGDPTRTLD